MIHWYDVTWMKTAGTSSIVWLAEVNIPSSVDGIEKLGALGMLGVFMWFTLTRLESAIRANVAATEASIKAHDASSIATIKAISDNSIATEKLTALLDNHKDKE